MQEQKRLRDKKDAKQSLLDWAGIRARAWAAHRRLHKPRGRKQPMLSRTAADAGVSLKAMLPLFEEVIGRDSVGVEIAACVAWALRVDLEWLLWGMGSGPVGDIVVQTTKQHQKRTFSTSVPMRFSST